MPMNYLSITLLASTIGAVVAVPLVPSDSNVINTGYRTEETTENRYALHSPGHGLPANVKVAAYNEQVNDKYAGPRETTDTTQSVENWHSPQAVDSGSYHNQAVGSGRYQGYRWNGEILPQDHNIYQQARPVEDRQREYAPAYAFQQDRQYAPVDVFQQGQRNTNSEPYAPNAPYAPFSPQIPAESQQGSSSCANHGEFMCNGRYLYGLCNWGHVIWQPVAAGTMCTPRGLDFDQEGYRGYGNNGEQVGAPSYAPYSRQEPAGTQYGSAACSNNGEFLCNGRYLYGLCNWGNVIWQPVAAGTMCTPRGLDYDQEGYRGYGNNGEQVGAPSYEPTVQQAPGYEPSCVNSGELSCTGEQQVRAPGYVSAPGYAPTSQGIPTTTQQHGSATCANNGEFLCNGKYLYGLCNWGNVIWQPVAAGTMCTPRGLDYDH